MSLYSITFSATGRTKAVADFLAQTWSNEFTSLDLSDPKWTPPAPFAAGDICLVTVPAYEGRVPKPAAQRLAQLEGNGATAILVATFGNRAIDDTLLELKDILEARGFTCRAAMESVTEHSIMPQFGANRPDEADKAELTDFVRQIKAAMAAGTLPQSVKVPGKTPYAEMGGLPFKPKGNKKCIKCGLCAQQCPVGAIPLDAPNTTDKTKCINCMRCTHICPTDARNYPAFLMAVAGAAMKKPLSGHKSNALYL